MRGTVGYFRCGIYQRLQILRRGNWLNIFNWFDMVMALILMPIVHTGWRAIVRHAIVVFRIVRISVHLHGLYIRNGLRIWQTLGSVLTVAGAHPSRLIRLYWFDRPLTIVESMQPWIVDITFVIVACDAIRWHRPVFISHVVDEILMVWVFAVIMIVVVTIVNWVPLIR